MPLSIIYNYPFEIRDFYSPGPCELSPGEALVFNALRAGNVKTNCEPWVKDAILRAEAQGRHELSEVELAELQTLIAEYDSTYMLGAKAPAEPNMPIWAIAKQVARDNLIANGLDPVPSALRALMTNPKVLARAREILRIQQRASAKELESLLEQL